MKRIAVIALLMILLAASTASADMYGSLRYAGMFNLKEIPKNLDATDGLAVAVCHFFQKEGIAKSPGSKSWEDFIKKNPGRIK